MSTTSTGEVTVTVDPPIDPTVERAASDVAGDEVVP